MYCRSCGSFVNDGKAYCSNCGSPVIQQPQPVVQPVCQQPVAANNNTVKRSKGFAIAGFCLGFETIFVCWVIFANALSVLSGLAGSILCIVGLVKKNGGFKAMAATGLIMTLLGMTVAILIWVAMFVPEVGKVFEPFYNVINELWKMKS
jgi:hypothetical protein